MKSAEEILNNKFKDSIPSEFNGQVWDKRLLEAMEEYAREACEEQREICANQIRSRFDALENISRIRGAEEPELK